MEKRPGDRDPGVVNESRQRPVPQIFGDDRGGVPHGFLIGHIHQKGNKAPPKLFLEATCIRGPPDRTVNLKTFSQEDLRNPPTDSGRSSGDNDTFITQSLNEAVYEPS